MNTPPRIDVYSHDRHEPRRAGTLRPSFMGRTLAGASFEYDPQFLTDGYALSPDLPLRPGRTFTPESATMFGAFADVSPDEWGRRIVQTAHTREARRLGERPRILGEFDFLLGVSDATRMGALRLQNPASGAWLSEDDAVANMHELPRILEAARRYERHEATDEDVAYLNGIATSPGGARPKTNILTSDGHLAIAKLPHSKDGDIDVERWEAVALTLARHAGVDVPVFQLGAGEGRKAVLVSERFDRTEEHRVPYISAHTAMGLGTHKSGSNLTYVDFADATADLAGDVRGNLHQLYRRIALTVLVGNADDHWRNHGFLLVNGQWSLSPAFDINPSRATTISSRRISPDADPDQRRIADLLAVADAFELTAGEAMTVACEVGAAVASWPDVARRLGVTEAEIAEMSSAFGQDQIDEVT
ncbi:type II toxin-antitoxin system HipA family toxin [Microbacterium sp. 18062]|uniref:type II toxin-antitoxin system HipA family toxin n=1 Tax=Microbacterium sp. 18062 TaxID=2681410 RepID=UPI001359282F|nr:type II toxin-antitoxin system HipA family toxin [Microbacterium sp. 18062]